MGLVEDMKRSLSQSGRLGVSLWLFTAMAACGGGGSVTAPSEPSAPQMASPAEDSTPSAERPAHSLDDASVTPQPPEDDMVVSAGSFAMKSPQPAAKGGSGGAIATAAGTDAGVAPQPAGMSGSPGVAGMAADAATADSFARLEAEMFGKPTLISSQFDLAEGPVWDHCDKRLLFVDVNNRKIHTFVPGGEVGVYMEQTNYVNGMVFDPEGRLVMAEMGGGSGGRITRMGRDKQIEVLIDHNTTGGKLQTSDDLDLRADGTIYFSDPDITHGPHVALSLGSAPFYQVKPGTPGMREIVRIGSGAGTNGIRLTLDMKTLLVNEYSGGNIAKYTVNTDGSVTAAGNFATGLTSPDSMCLDVAGNVYVGVSTGIQVLRKDGSKVALLRVGSRTTSCAFGGADGKTLFISAWSKLLQLDNMPVPGLAWQQNKSVKCD
jgi:gluconolactonase